ncbi:hypothetical protein SAMN06265338_1443 [Rhodoblastus acidophilus]|uniref:Hpt domain-containing protein n=1 Tax=Rhodoblastus acidophilus TaxID=1074 RepID=A0A212SHC3_RHOAC|nr:hypothetical protein [Rhodoblastus acidophilus]MCW2318752.1 hypothetical protein [Rhodoblastus acidophilus]SNB85106.1 hypothetical protein SAMN06265338_1443 [Rhodoblastus acidophilus]
MAAPPLDENAAQAIDALRRQFGQRLEQELRVLSSCADRFDVEPDPASDVAILRQICHLLMGSAGLFGFHAIADAAADAHAAVKDGRSGPGLGLVTRALAGQIIDVLASHFGVERSDYDDSKRHAPSGD